MNIQRDIEQLKRLNIPNGLIDVVIDTDTYNEIDDQFALVYALESKKRLNIKALYAAPFQYTRAKTAEIGMTKSYHEIETILSMYTNTPNVYKGATRFMDGIDDVVESDVVNHLIELSKDYDKDNQLIVVAIGALTNIASALNKDNTLKDRILLVWLGGSEHHRNNTFPWRDNPLTFNIRQDITAAKVILQSDVPLIQIPGNNVAMLMTTTIHELKAHLKQNPKTEFLINRFNEYKRSDFAYSKPLWDVAVIGFLVNEAFVPTEIKRRPLLSDEGTYTFDDRNGLVRVAHFVFRDDIYRDLFEKMNRT